MIVVSIAAHVVYVAAIVLFYTLWGRVILDFVRQLRRDWKPRGLWLALSVVILTVTDPVLRVARRVIRPIRVGAAMVDVAMLILMASLILVMLVTPAWF